MDLIVCYNIKVNQYLFRYGSKFDTNQIKWKFKQKFKWNFKSKFNSNFKSKFKWKFKPKIKRKFKFQWVFGFSSCLFLHVYSVGSQWNNFTWTDSEYWADFCYHCHSFTCADYEFTSKYILNRVYFSSERRHYATFHPQGLFGRHWSLLFNVYFMFTFKKE